MAIIIKHKVGDTFRYRLAVTDPENLDGDGNPSPVNITGWTFVASGKAKGSRSTPEITFVCTIIDPVGGIVEILATAAETALWKLPADYLCDISYVDDQSDDVSSPSFVIKTVENY